nr:DUF3566 domain-containing protein [Klebsiella oxytoca]
MDGYLVDNFAQVEVIFTDISAIEAVNRCSVFKLGVVTSVHICAIIATVLAVIVLYNMVSTFAVRDTNISGAVYPISDRFPPHRLPESIGAELDSVSAHISDQVAF